MRNILFVGLSSFTGFYFVKHLSKNKKNKIYCVLTKSKKKYDHLKKKRINIASKIKNVHLLYNIKFGDKKFIKLVEKIKFEIFCFHHAHTDNYNDNFKFNLKKSIKENLNNVDNIFNKISNKSKIIITNTVFQKIERKKYKPLNNYGISKTVSYEKIKQLCRQYDIKYKSIFIPNPWGILEEKKLNFYLINNWLNNNQTIVKYPNYIRDNIHIDKLSKEYNKVVNSKSKKIEYFPSQYCSSNKVFIEALRKKFEKFFKIKTSVIYSKNTKYDQPIERINGSKVLNKLNFNENLNKYFKYYFKIVKKFN